jgi:hypothetical protein
MRGADPLRGVDLALDIVHRRRAHILAARLLGKRGQVGQHIGGRAVAFK